MKELQLLRLENLVILQPLIGNLERLNWKNENASLAFQKYFADFSILAKKNLSSESIICLGEKEISPKVLKITPRELMITFGVIEVGV